MVSGGGLKAENMREAGGGRLQALGTVKDPHLYHSCSGGIWVDLQQPAIQRVGLGSQRAQHGLDLGAAAAAVSRGIVRPPGSRMTLSLAPWRHKGFQQKWVPCLCKPAKNGRKDGRTST